MSEPIERLGSVLAECDSSGNLTATRSYDVYRAVRTSAGTSTSKHKYVGSLGHPSEDESGLIYMQARYMDPVCGRFVSEDPAKHGGNWFLYCGNNSTNLSDSTGKFPVWQAMCWLFGQLFATIALSEAYFGSWASALGFASLAIIAFGTVMVSGTGNVAFNFITYGLGLLMTGPGTLWTGLLTMSLDAAKLGQYTMARTAVVAVYVYGLELMGALIAADYAFETGQ